MKAIVAIIVASILYITVANLLGNYQLTYTTAYNYRMSNEQGTEVSLGSSHQLEVIVKRAGQFCLFGRCLLPSYIYIKAPRIYFDNWRIYFSDPEPQEIKIRLVNFIFLAISSSLMGIILGRKYLYTKS